MALDAGVERRSGWRARQALPRVGQCVESAEHLIKQHTEPGDLVLDALAGSGTVLLAAFRLRRRAIGFELDPERYVRACDRLDSECSPG